MCEKVVNFTHKTCEKVVNKYYARYLVIVLKRKMTDVLLEWKHDRNKKCLLVKGARQVGKTYIIDDFAKKHYKNYVYINFELSKDKRTIFEGDLDMDTLIIKISAHFGGVKLEPGKTLIFLDEIQSCPGARVALKTFTMDKRFDVIASGSLLGLNYKEVSSYPVGYETTVWMHPLDFEEFLWAYGIDRIVIDHVSGKVRGGEKLDDSILKKFEEYFRLYMTVGGMPDAVNVFLSTKNMGEVLRVQRDIIRGYMNDIAKYLPDSEKQKAQSCLLSVPAQLGKKNKKFTYTDVESKKNTGSRDYGESLSWLHDAGIISYCYNLNEPALPLAANRRMDSFKVYMKDTGLLVSMLDEGTAAAIISDNLEINEGGVTENVIAGIIDRKGMMLNYFERKGRLEVDFVLNLGDVVAIVEVKSGNNRQSRSLDTLMKDKHKMKKGIKLESSNMFTDEAGVEHYPLFATEFLLPKSVESL